MVGIHVPVSQWHKWAAGMKAATFKAIKSPITIASTSQASYSASMVHNPLRSSDTFYLWKNREAPRPTHNAIALGKYNPKGKWRGFWSDVQIIKDFNKQKGEVLERHSVMMMTGIMRIMMMMRMMMKMTKMMMKMMKMMMMLAMLMMLMPVAEDAAGAGGRARAQGHILLPQRR